MSFASWIVGPVLTWDRKLVVDWEDGILEWARAEDCRRRGFTGGFEVYPGPWSSWKTTQMWTKQLSTTIWIVKSKCIFSNIISVLHVELLQSYKPKYCIKEDDLGCLSYPSKTKHVPRKMASHFWLIKAF